MKQNPGCRVLLAACAAAFLLMALPAQADVEAGTTEIGFDFGLTYFDADVGGTGGRFQMRGGYHLTNLFQWELQGGVSYESSKRDTTLYNLAVNGVFNFHPRRNVVPYVLVGIGGAQLNLDVADDTGAFYQVAGGSRFYGSAGKVGLRLEGGFMGASAFSENTTHFNVLVGFTFTIGGGHPHPDAEDRLDKKMKKNHW